MVHLLLIGKMPGVNSELAETCDFTISCLPCHDLHISAVETVSLGFFEALSILRHAILKILHVVVMLLRGNTRLEVVIRLAEIFA